MTKRLAALALAAALTAPSLVACNFGGCTDDEIKITSSLDGKKPKKSKSSDCDDD